MVMFLTISGWLIALASLIVNILQLRTNNALKAKITNPTQTVGNHSNGTQQTHSGTGDNITVKGNADIKKS